MAIWQLGNDAITKLDETTFSASGIRERDDLQRLLRSNIGVIADDTLVIAEEYGDWADARRRIDLLGVDKAGRLVVIELKRTDDGGHMDLQALRYAAMVSTMTFRRAVDVYAAHLIRIGEPSGDAEARLLDFLGWSEPDDAEFATDVRIVLASAEFSKEITTTVLWLRDRDVDVRCVRLKPYRWDGKLLIDVQQIVPLPEAAEYQVQLREKAEQVRNARESSLDFTRFDLTVQDVTHRSLSKRALMLELARAAVSAGVTPEQFATHLPGDRWRWVWVDGEVDAAAFLAELPRLRTPRGGSYEARRFFVDDGDLFHVGGRTYALTNQWGGESWVAAVTAVIGAYPQLRASYRVSEEN
jgi:hypothetical protein